MSAEVWNCESGDRIKGCDGTCVHATNSLAGVGGWSITKVAAFSIFCAIPLRRPISRSTQFTKYLLKAYNSRRRNSSLTRIAARPRQLDAR